MCNRMGSDPAVRRSNSVRKVNSVAKFISYEQGKRTIDFFVSLAGLLLLFPILLAVALLVRIKLGSPVMFTQLRPGLHGRPFQILKFRSMTNARDSSGKVLSDNSRLTKCGERLRSSSLDELPELWNVLKGDMSLVGPRPLLMQYLPLYSIEQARRHEVRPGITGWAQVNGRNALSWEEKFKLDVWYVDNRSLMLDFRIVMMTVSRVLRSDGISQDGHVTAAKFIGNDK